MFRGVEEDPRPVSVFLAGDFNSEPTQEAYMKLAGADSPVQDVMGIALEKMYGHKNTFTGFGYEDKPEKRIDFLFIGPRKADGWKVKSYAVLESRFEDGVYNSDHRAVVGDFILDG
jgi:endonuclease/exonuclease/phosphatase family metal-dependent hydrolase